MDSLYTWPATADCVAFDASDAIKFRSQLGDMAVDAVVISEILLEGFVAAEDVVESCISSIMSHVWSVASGANETRRFATVFS